MYGEKPLSVLVVDDTDEKRAYTTEVIREKLQHSGFKVEIVPASTVDEAVKALEAKPVETFDIIAIDLNLEEPPKPDPCEAGGYKLLQQIAEHPRWQSAYRILYSAITMRGDVPASANGLELYKNYVWIHRSARNRRQQLEQAVEDAIATLV